ncbi:MAG: restriction endonuclease subunit S [Cyanobacteriota bacterium]|jgi:type I restriction enzyme S subunit
MARNWTMVSLGEVMNYRKEFIIVDDLTTYKRPRVQLHARGIIVRDEITGSDIKTKSQQVCRAGEFLVAEIDAKVGGFGIVPDELDGAIVSSHYFLFEINEAKLDRRFLDYFSRTPSFREQIEAKGSTNYAAIRPSHVLQYEIPLPPLEEQRRIVARIEELETAIGEARRLRHQSIEEIKAIFNATTKYLFSPPNSQSWESLFLGDIADIHSGVPLGRRIAGKTISLPYLRVANVQDRFLDLTQIKTVEILESEKDKWILQDGDLLLTEGGDWDKLGRGTVWRNEISNCIHQNHIFRVRVNKQEFDPDYLSILISSHYGKSYFQSASKQTTNLATINRRQLNAFVVLKPTLAEQRHIVAYLDDLQTKIDSLKRLQAETAAELDALLPSILDKAFKGEL